MVNGLRFLPDLFCLKIGDPFDVRKIEIKAAAKNGEMIKKITAAMIFLRKIMRKIYGNSSCHILH